jgi:phage terminase small subunit
VVADIIIITLYCNKLKIFRKEKQCLSNEGIIFVTLNVFICRRHVVVYSVSHLLADLADSWYTIFSVTVGT